MTRLNLPRLDLVAEGAVIHSFPLPEGEHVVGRAPESDIRLVDKSVSKLHARISVHRSPDFPDVLDATLHDAGSTNGTRVNGERTAERRLCNGDIIEFGFTEMHFIAPGGTDADDTGFMIHENL